VSPVTVFANQPSGVAKDEAADPGYQRRERSGHSVVSVILVIVAVVLVALPARGDTAWFGQKPTVDTNFRSEGAPIRLENSYHNSILTTGIGVEVASFDENYAYLNRDAYVIRVLGAANIRRGNFPASVYYYSARANDYFFESSGITGDDMGKWFSLTDIGGFWYYGQRYYNIFVCANGWAAFQYAGNVNSCPFIPQALPTADTTTETPDGVLAPFWRDLNPAAGGQIGVSRASDGTSISFIWKQVANFAYSGVNTFTLTLHKPSAITFEYGSVSYIGGTKVGFEDPAGVFGQELDYNTAVAQGGVRIQFRGNVQLLTSSRFVVDKQDSYDSSDVLWDRNEVSGVNVRASNPTLSAGQQAVADIAAAAAWTAACLPLTTLGCLLLTSGVAVTSAVLAGDQSKVPPDKYAASDLGQTQRTGFLQLPVMDENSGMWGTDMSAFDVFLWKVPKDSNRHVLEIQFGVYVDYQILPGPDPRPDPNPPGPFGWFWTGVVLTVASGGVLFADTFERNPWTPGSDPDSPSWLYWTMGGLWHSTGRRDADAYCTCYALHSAWYGQESTGNYNTGYQTYGALTSPLINIRSTSFRLDYDSWWSTETGTAYDKKLVQISIDRGATWTTLVQISEATDARSTWVTHTHSLAGYVGKEILVRFYFDSVDNIYNTFEGWYIDRVFVRIP